MTDTFTPEQIDAMNWLTDREDGIERCEDLGMMVHGVVHGYAACITKASLDRINQAIALVRAHDGMEP